MSNVNNVVRLADFRLANQQEQIDDISANAFLLLRDAALEAGIPVKSVMLEHLRDIIRIFNSVEGDNEARAILKQVEEQILG